MDEPARIDVGAQVMSSNLARTVGFLLICSEAIGAANGLISSRSFKIFIRGYSDGTVMTLKRFSEYSKTIMTMILATVVAYYPVREDITKDASSRPYFMVCRSLLYFAFLSDLALMVLTSCLLRLGRISERLYITAKILIHTTGVLMMLTSVSLMLLRNPSYDMVTILVLPVMAICIMVFYKGINTDQAHEDTGYEAHQSKLKEFLNLSASITIAAFGGMLATIFGYFKNSLKKVGQVDVKYSEAFIFFTVIFGLLAMLLTTIPPSLHCPNARSRFITFIKVLSHSLFGLLGLIGLAVAAEFLKELIFLAFFPIFIAVAVWLSMEFFRKVETSQAHRPTSHESEPDNSSIAITTFIFATLMMVYSVYFGSADSDFHLKTCIFFMTLAFMSSLSWMLLAFRRPRTQSLDLAVKILTYSTIVWLVFAMLDLIFLAILTDYCKEKSLRAPGPSGSHGAAEPSLFC